MEIDFRNRYRYTTAYSGASGEYFGTRPPVEIPESPNDRFHRVTEAEVRRIDLISYRYYGDVRLWWIIAEANNITDPTYLTPGRILRIPSKDVVYMKVLP